MTPEQQNEIYQRLRDILSQKAEELKVTKDTESVFELYGQKPVTAYGKTVDQMYFAAAQKMKNHVGFYFFPIYTHPQKFADIPENLRKALKGKSCFHVKKMDEDLLGEIDRVLDRGLELYKSEDWI